MILVLVMVSNTIYICRSNQNFAGRKIFVTIPQRNRHFHRGKLNVLRSRMKSVDTTALTLMTTRCTTYTHSKSTASHVLSAPPMFTSSALVLVLPSTAYSGLESHEAVLCHTGFPAAKSLLPVRQSDLFVWVIC